jgi:glycosyltransferase involved in cell wall biosynthesis
MMLGLPIVAVAATDVGAAVPPEAGVVTADRRVLQEGMRRFLEDPESARLAGKAARRAALEKYNVSRFLKDWDFLLERC